MLYHLQVLNLREVLVAVIGVIWLKTFKGGRGESPGGSDACVS
jgi:hypothetical protein